MNEDLNASLVDGFVCMQPVKWYPVDSANAVPSTEVLKQIVHAGIGVAIYARPSGAEGFSLQFLEPVIEHIRSLSLHGTAAIDDARVLEGARALQMIDIAAKLDSVIALDHLPSLIAFEGRISREVVSVTQNSTLRFTRIAGAIPKLARNFVGPVNSFWQEGGRADVELPLFAQPEALEHIERNGARSLNLSQLRQFAMLKSLRVTDCSELTHLEVIDTLPQLKDVQILGCETLEDWSVITKPDSLMLHEVRPPPNASFVVAGNARGWSLGDDSNSTPHGIWVEKSGDDERWAVFQNDFSALAAATDQIDDRPATGRDAEAIILAATAELRSEGHDIVGDPDSESGTAVVYFNSREHADQVVERTRMIWTRGTKAVSRILQDAGTK